MRTATHKPACCSSFLHCRCGAFVLSPGIGSLVLCLAAANVICTPLLSAVKCVAQPGDLNPPTKCCDQGVECKFDTRPNPADPTKPIGYSCITSAVSREKPRPCLSLPCLLLPGTWAFCPLCKVPRMLRVTGSPPNSSQLSSLLPTCCSAPPSRTVRLTSRLMRTRCRPAAASSAQTALCPSALISPRAASALCRPVAARAREVRCKGCLGCIISVLTRPLSQTPTPANVVTGHHLRIITAVKCNPDTLNEICCANPTDHCYNKDGNTANGDEACCPNGECPLECRG